MLLDYTPVGHPSGEWSRGTRNISTDQETVESQCWMLIGQNSAQAAAVNDRRNISQQTNTYVIYFGYRIILIHRVTSLPLPEKGKFCFATTQILPPLIWHCLVGARNGDQPVKLLYQQSTSVKNVAWFTAVTGKKAGKITKCSKPKCSKWDKQRDRVTLTSDFRLAHIQMHNLQLV